MPVPMRFYRALHLSVQRVPEVGEDLGAAGGVLGHPPVAEPLEFRGAGAGPPCRAGLLFAGPDPGVFGSDQGKTLGMLER